MKQKMLFLILILFTGLIYSCKTDNEPEPITPTSYPNFSKLKVGNYWAYEQFEIDAEGNAASKNIFDSCYVEIDTIINGETYFKIVKPKPYYTNQFEVSFQKDSLLYTVNSDGKILFSSQDFSTIFASHYVLGLPGDTVCLIIRQMADKDLSIATPAGVFVTSNAKETFQMYPNWTSAGSMRYRHVRYAENIGIVIETLPLYASNPSYIERRLVRYHLD